MLKNRGLYYKNGDLEVYYSVGSNDKITFSQIHEGFAKFIPSPAVRALNNKLEALFNEDKRKFDIICVKLIEKYSNDMLNSVSEEFKMIK